MNVVVYVQFGAEARDVPVRRVNERRGKLVGYRAILELGGIGHIEVAPANLLPVAEDNLVPPSDVQILCGKPARPDQVVAGRIAIVHERVQIDRVAVQVEPSTYSA